MRSTRTGQVWFSIMLFTFAFACVTLPQGARAAVLIVNDGESIQAAVDAAQPGDLIEVKDGTYTGMAGYDSVVTVRKNNITIKGSKKAIIEASGFEYGIMVGDDAPITAAGCPPITVIGFKLQGLTIQNATDTGVRLVGVDGFTLTLSSYLDNAEYGPFPVCSKNGVVSHNFASGHKDAAIYIGDCDNVSVNHNIATDSVVGAEIENSINCEVTHNTFHGNTGGLLIFVLPGLPQPFTDNVLVAHNKIFDNNRTNDGAGAVAGVPEGTGILMFGADNVTMEYNDIRDNNSFGIGVIGNFNVFFDPRIEPFNDNLRVAHNTILGNGASPDALRSFVPGVDIVFLFDVFDPGTGMLLLNDPDPSDNCFTNNQFGTDFPPGIVSAFPCP